MAPEARKDRSGRITEFRSGAWTSASQDFIVHATTLFELSARYARAHDGNVSPFALSGIPLLFASLRALLIEANSGMYGTNEDLATLAELSRCPNDLAIVKSSYGIDHEREKRLALLYEVRNELVHPAHRPAGTTHNTPNSMLRLRELGVLQSTNRADCDYDWISQLQSHRLFTLTFETIAGVAELILNKHHADGSNRESHLRTYTRFRSIAG